MPDERPAITPEMKVGQLLEHYPEAEATLFELSPAFQRLRNPVLRRTVARVTSLRQAATVGGVDLGLLINSLRRQVGQEVADIEDESAGPGARPEWLLPDRIQYRVDIRPILAAGEKPVGKVLVDLAKLPAGRIYELTAPFVPAPLIDIARERGFEVWWKKESKEVTLVYFCKDPEAAAAGPLVSLG